MALATPVEDELVLGAPPVSGLEAVGALAAEWERSVTGEMVAAASAEEVEATVLSALAFVERGNAVPTAKSATRMRTVAPNTVVASARRSFDEPEGA